MGSQGILDFAHGGNDVVPALGAGIGAEDFVSDEEVPYYSMRVKWYDVGSDPLVGDGLVGGDVGDELVGDHDRDLKVCVFEGFEDFWIGVVDFNALGFEGFNLPTVTAMADYFPADHSLPPPCLRSLRLQAKYGLRAQ